MIPRILHDLLIVNQNPFELAPFRAILTSSTMTLDQVLSIVSESDKSGMAMREYAMQQLAAVPGYDWCGVYALDGDELVLDAYVGAPTEHGRIPIGVGVCGSAVAENRNKIIADVREEENYLACSLETRSEAVVLIKNAEGTILGQIDIDGHQVGRFTADDERALSALAEQLAARWN